MIGRDSKWRQGCVLTTRSAAALGLVPLEDGGRRVFVIAHDCDLMSEKENSVEAIIGQSIDTPEPRSENSRDPRRLHLSYHAGASFELIQANKVIIEKVQFCEIAEIDEEFLLSGDCKRILKQWLAGRYGRPAFPNNFENRLKKKVTSKRTVQDNVARILEPVQTYISHVFLDLGEGRTAELDDGEPYVLGITLAYYAEEGADARVAAEDAAVEISDLFAKAYGPPWDSAEIQLEYCEAMADTMITLADIRKIDQFNFEYMSLAKQPKALGDEAIPAGA